ncbi:hypothetical protein [Dyella silvatica]|uniref:hypothetical protein n=1 Tax=Dyella silvatica TaxID=2992128 RepID=UPI002254CF2E|nr:hypothetical protein [Dyella silvatica]
MSIQNINLGTAPSGADGDSVRTAFSKCANNDADLDTRVSAALSMANASLPKSGGNLTGKLVTAYGMGESLQVMQPMVIFGDPSGRKGGLTITTNGSNAYNSAYLAFERAGMFGCYFGINQSNELCVGGWSMGASVFRIWHEGNTVVDANNFIKKA